MPMGYDGMDVEEQIVNDAVEQLGKRVLIIQIIKRLYFSYPFL
jgi:hypothetical protein